MNFVEFKLMVAEWSWEDNIDAVLPSLVAFGQQELERQLRLRAMEFLLPGVSGELTTGAVSAVLPADFIELIYLTVIDGTNRYPIEKRYDAKSMQSMSVDSAISGIPDAISIVGDTIYFNKKMDKNYTYDEAYFRHLPALINDSDSNWWVANAAEALLYATLKKLAIFTKSAAEITQFDALMKEQAVILADEDKKQRENGTANTVSGVRVR
jgi:hypothetical protein